MISDDAVKELIKVSGIAGKDKEIEDIINEFFDIAQEKSEYDRDIHDFVFNLKNAIEELKTQFKDEEEILELINGLPQEFFNKLQEEIYNHWDNHGNGECPVCGRIVLDEYLVPCLCSEYCGNECSFCSEECNSESIKTCEAKKECIYTSSDW